MIVIAFVLVIAGYGVAYWGAALMRKQNQGLIYTITGYGTPRTAAAA